MLRQTVNDNATSRITARSLVTIAEAVIRSFDRSRTATLLRLIAVSLKRPWMKALVLDQLVHLVHRLFLRSEQPNVSFVFLNAGAHIQHHYFFNSEFAVASSSNPEWYVNSEADPVRDMLVTYDRILADYIALSRQGTRVIVATGLTQVPYDRIKYYYRISDHAKFLELAGIHFSRVLPRMTRDFEVTFDDQDSAQNCAESLRSMVLERTSAPLFQEIELRERSVFATLTYPDEIRRDDAVILSRGRLEGFGQLVAFVAIKNGMHSKRGFAYLSPNAPIQVPPEPVHVAALYDLTMQAATTM
jgi:hypothetical protein